MGKNRGFFKDPVVCLGIISGILFLTFSLVLTSVSLSLTPRQESFFLAQVSETLPKSPFLDQAGNSKPESPSFLLVENSSIRAATPPVMVTPQILGALVDGFEIQDVQKVVVEYIVEPGDTLSSIAGQFNVSLNTVLWANSLTQNSLLKVGQKLTISPVSGVIYHVKSGDTISAISQKYKAKAEEIISFNELSNGADIFVGDILIVPNGVLPKTAASSYVLTPLPSSYFICPIASPCRITQNLHWYNAVDFSHSTCGEPIYAAAGGTVLRVNLTNSASRWAFGGGGNHLTILHPNGVVTYYGHLQASLVNPGDQVSQGQIIALMGGQPGTPGAGKSTGCHVHFGVSGARNPFAR
jgi:LysM repeat protein